VSTVADDPTLEMRVIVDPRFRQRWIEVRRSQGRRRLHLAAAAVAVVVVLGGAAGVAYSPLLGVRHVRVVGAGGYTPAQIAAAAGLHHQALLEVDASAVAARLEAVAGIDRATVRVEWPSTVRIQVTLRHAVAQAAGPQGVAQLDPTGRVLAWLPGPVPALPLVSGLPLTDVAVGAWVPGTAGPHASVGAQLPGGTAGLAAAALALCANLPAALAPTVQSVDVSSGDLRAVVSNPAGGQVTVRFGDESDLGRKLTSLATLFQQADLHGVTLIDLRVPDRPALVGG